MAERPTPADTRGPTDVEKPSTICHIVRLTRSKRSALRNLTDRPSGCSAAWLARLTGGQKVAGSNPVTPTTEAVNSQGFAAFLL